MSSGPLRLKRGRSPVLADDGYALDQPDPRREDAKLLDQDDQAGRETLADLFAGTDLMNNPEKVSLILRVRSEVREQWTKARDSFLTIGRALLDLDEDRTLTEPEKARLKRGSSRVFPFSDTVATQLRVVARAIRDGRFPESQCPSAYSTAYQLSALTDDELAVARERDLIRPDVPRSAVIEFRKELRTRDLDPDSRRALEWLRNQKIDLERQLDRTKVRLRTLQANLAGVNEKLKQFDPG